MKVCLVVLAVLGLSWAAPNVKTSRALVDDMAEFTALIPTTDIMALFLDYLSNDLETQELMAYLQGPEVASLISYLESQPEFTELINWLISKGLDPVGGINTIHDILGLPLYVLPTRRAASSRTVRELIDAIKALIPEDQLLALFNDKLVCSPEFKELYDRIAAQPFHDYVLRVLATTEAQNLITKLKGYGIDVDLAIQTIKDLLGWTRSARTLEEDYAQFYALLPIDQIRAIVTNYKTTDAEVQAAIAYLESPEFKTITDAIKAAPEYQQVVQFLLDHGLDLYALLNRVAELLGIPPFIPPTRYQPHSRTFRAMLDEIKAILPTAELQAMFDDKYATSPEFTALVDSLRSAEFTAFTQAVDALPEWQDMVNRLAALGVDVAAIDQFLFDLFGWPVRRM